jgi:hypothetical protein
MIGRPRGAAAITALALIVVGGCEETVRVELDIASNPTGCGLDPATVQLQIDALAEEGIYPPVLLSTTDGPQTLTEFPADTRQLALAALDANSAVIAHGKTAAFRVEDRPGSVPVTLLPVGGLCATGPLAVPRRRPIVAAVGAGALVIGGFTIVEGVFAPVRDVEYFDPLTNTFRDLAVPETLSGFAGGSVATLTDGRLVVIGGDQPYYLVYDPVAEAFAPAAVVFEERAHAAVVGVDDHRVLIAGGCANVDDDGRCTGIGLASVKLLDVDTGVSTSLTNLSHPRHGGTAVLERAADGTTIAVIGGGVDDTGAAATDVERVPLIAGRAIEITTGVTGGLAVALPTGGLFTALAPAGLPASAAASIAVPGLATARAIPDAPRARRDAVLVALEDGTALAVGGVDGTPPDEDPAPLLVYRPTQGWASLGQTPAEPLVEHGAARLADGSVLVVGGRTAGDAASGAAFRYRPPLLGPFAAQARVTPSSDTEEQLVPFDPDAVERTDGNVVLVGAAGLDNYALIAGPLVLTGALDALIGVDGGGVALYAQATAPGTYLRAVLVPGQPARLEQWTGGARDTLCTAGGAVPPLGAGIAIALEIDGDRVRVTRGTGAPDLDCRLDDPGVAGLWGIGVIGDGARVAVSTIGVSR